jgi:HEAT repeat protein
MGMSNVRDTNMLMGEALKSLASRALTAKDPLTRKHAIYLLGMTRNPDCVELFIKAFRDPEKAVRAQATRALAGMGEMAENRLINLLKDPDWKVRYRAVEALGLIRDIRVVDPLIERLSDEKDHVRYMAVKALGEIGARDAIGPISSLDDDENQYVRRISESVIEKLKSPTL